MMVATKVGMLAGRGGDRLAPARILAACDESLARLGVETIDLYFAHQDDDSVAQEDVLAAFDTLVAAGKVRAIGASNFHAARLKSALDIATRTGLPHYRVLQPEYNLVSRHRFEGELQDLCVAHNIGVVPYYGLASGFLTGKYRSREDLRQSVRGNRMGDLLEGKGAAVLALAWLAAQPGIVAPIASETSIAQLDELSASWNLILTPDQLTRLTAAGA